MEFIKIFVKNKKLLNKILKRTMMMSSKFWKNQNKKMYLKKIKKKML